MEPTPAVTAARLPSCHCVPCKSLGPLVRSRRSAAHEEPEPIATSEYREAQAEAAAARARARALRPWYRKKRYLLGVPIALFLVLVGVALLGAFVRSTNGSTSTGAGARAPGSADAQPMAAVGDVVSVGSLDLTVTSFDPAFDAARYNRVNRASVAVQFRATNARGDEGKEYEFFLNAFKVVDAAGVTYPRAICVDCPGEFATRGLIRGGTLEGTAYFEVPPGATLTELIYDPLFSNNRARIALR